MEVNGVVGDLFKVCEAHSEGRLYLKDHLKKGGSPIFLATV
jgi:hypothetical protein